MNKKQEPKVDLTESVKEERRKIQLKIVKNMKLKIY